VWFSPRPDTRRRDRTVVRRARSARRDSGDGGVYACHRPTADATQRMKETVLDLRGLRCPLPVLRARKAIRSVAIGDALVLECTDPLTVIDVPHFVNETGQMLLSQEKLEDLYVFRIVKRR
jgi:tRNA 2-thiouridine synthesizing protein A